MLHRVIMQTDGKTSVESFRHWLSTTQSQSFHLVCDFQRSRVFEAVLPAVDLVVAERILVARLKALLANHAPTVFA